MSTIRHGSSGNPARSQDRGGGPRVTVAMAAYNAESTLVEAIESVLWQTMDDWELLVADDGSTDRTSEILAGFRDPRIRPVGDARNRGKPARMNQMIASARAPLLAVMDADDLSFPERLAVQCRFMDSHPEIDLMAAGMATFDELGRLGRWKRLGVEHSDIVARPWEGFHFNSPTWMGRTEWFARFKYREDLQAAEDEDLLLRSYRTSRFAGITSVLLAYRIDQWSWKKAKKMRRDHVRALLAEVRRAGNPTAAAGVILHAAKLGREGLAVLTGQQQRVLDHRIKPLPEEEEAYLRVLLSRMSASSLRAEVQL